MISEDMEELITCYNGKAYKAAIIMAGSILEAVLIDWLSEIKGINYFEEQYKVVDMYWDKKTKKLLPKKDELGRKRYKNADLVDYIDAIKEIKKPYWMEQANDANKIRTKRNLVHAKLCLKENIKLDENMCGEIIGYLKNIIKSREEQEI